MRWFSKKPPKEDPQALLLQGVKENDLEKIDKALAANADIDHHYPNVAIHLPDNAWTKQQIVVRSDLTPLAIALRGKQEALAIALLNRGANPLEPVANGAESPIQNAMWSGNDLFIDAVVAHGYKLKDLCAILARPGFTADFKETIAMLNVLFASGGDVNACDSEGRTPLDKLLRVCYLFSLSRLYIQALLNAGADIHAPTPEGRTVLENVAFDRLYLPIITKHVDTLQEGLRCEYGAGIEPQRLLKDGKPTPELLQYCGAGMLGELFSQYRWHGKEAQALALFDEARAAVPEYYKPKMDTIDLSVLRRAVVSEESDSAVKRYVRRPATPEAKR